MRVEVCKKLLIFVVPIDFFEQYYHNKALLLHSKGKDGFIFYFFFF